MNDLLTVLEVMSYLKVCRATVQRWCKEGKLPAVKIGKEYRIRRSDLENWYNTLLNDRTESEQVAVH
ncbi:MAG: helix-turn-helix domain-containing protein [Chloroflexi bacterium]|nr:helix-turn-helix domain-containing protein [Chloroflexota bacterium]